LAGGRRRFEAARRLVSSLRRFRGTGGGSLGPPRRVLGTGGGFAATRARREISVQRATAARWQEEGTD